MIKDKHFGSEKEAIQYLHKSGYNVEFYLNSNGFWNGATKMIYPFRDAMIIETIFIKSQKDSSIITFIYVISFVNKVRGYITDFNRE